MAGDRAAVSSLVLKIPDIDARQATFENIPFVRRYRWHPLRVARQPPTFLLPHWRLRSEEHTSELQSLKRISYAVFCLKKKNNKKNNITTKTHFQHTDEKTKAIYAE